MRAERIRELEIGTVLGDYRLERRLGEGGMAVTYQAVHVRTGEDVVIKAMKATGVGDAELGARFVRESEVMRRLGESPNVVGVFGIGTHVDGRCYIVMERVRGVDLLEELRRWRDPATRPIARICSIARDVARALAKAHAAGVIHRDVKPSNIMLAQTADGEIAKLLDFGVSADLGKRGLERTLTRVGVSVGTPEYMSPEQTLALDAAPSFDIFALGVTLHEMVTGRLPPHAIELSKGVPELELDSGVPMLDALIRACLEPNPADRLASAQEVIARLDAILVQLRHPSSSGRSPRGKAVWIAAALGVVGTCGGLAALAWKASPERLPPPEQEAREAQLVHVDADPAPALEAPDEPGTGDDDLPAPSDEPDARSSQETIPAKPRGRVEALATGCETQREQAQQAKAQARWRDVLRATKSKACWTQPSQRQQMRVEAWLELGEYERCVAEGAEVSDRIVGSMVDFCKRKSGGAAVR